MNLLPGETILLQSRGRSLTLTTHRIRLDAESFGSAQIKSIMLEQLASCALVKNSQPILLIIAGVCFLLSLFAAGGGRDGGVLIVGIVVAGIFVALYFFSQRQILAFASAGTTIIVNTQGMKVEDAKAFIEQAEMVKNMRYFARSQKVEIRS